MKKPYLYFFFALKMGLTPIFGFNLPDTVTGTLILLNDNGAWCWYQDERAIVDQANGSLLVGSVAAMEGPGGRERSGNVELTHYDIATGSRNITVLHRQLEADDHNTPSLFLRPDGRYIAMYTKHNADYLSRWRISGFSHDAGKWEPEQVFNWQHNTTYSNLHYLSAEGRLYNFARSINCDPCILISTDYGDSWSYCGKLLTEKLLGYVNGYTRYASNGVDRIDFITTEHHPRDFNNNIYHGYIKNLKLHTSDGKIIDHNLSKNIGRSQTELTKIFNADSVWNNEEMSHAWTTDLRLDNNGHPVALFTCRANFSRTKRFNDHRFFYARYDGNKWHVHQIGKAGPRLWGSEQDYTGLGAIHPQDTNTLYLSTPIDPQNGFKLAHHEIFKGHTRDGGETWEWIAITKNSTVDNLRPIVPIWDTNHTALLWFRGTMKASQTYNTSIVGIIENKQEKPGALNYLKKGVEQITPIKLQKGTYAIFAFFKPGNSSENRAGLKTDRLTLFPHSSCQKTMIENAVLCQAYLGRADVRDNEPIEIYTSGNWEGVGYSLITNCTQ